MFTKEDQGKYKSQRAAEIINARYHNTTKFLVKRIEDLPADTLDHYDAVFGAFDNIEARMNLNLMFRRSSCRILIDCGISGYQAHVKAVYENSACLYCIRDLYHEKVELNICSLRSVPEKVTPENRSTTLRSLVEFEKDLPGSKTSKIERITNSFNMLVGVADHKVTMFDVAGIYDEIMPNVSFMNSVCAGLACNLLSDENPSFDFVFYTAEDKISITKLLLSRDEQCIVCKLEKPTRK